MKSDIVINIILTLLKFIKEVNMASSSAMLTLAFSKHFIFALLRAFEYAVSFACDLTPLLHFFRYQLRCHHFREPAITTYVNLIETNNFFFKK